MKLSFYSLNFELLQKLTYFKSIMIVHGITMINMTVFPGILRFLLSFLHFYVCVVHMCLCMRVQIQAQFHVYVHACGGLRLMLGVRFYHSLIHYALSQVSLRELTSTPSLTSQLTLEFSGFNLPRLEWQAHWAFTWVLGTQILFPWACAVSTLAIIPT